MPGSIGSSLVRIAVLTAFVGLSTLRAAPAEAQTLPADPSFEPVYCGADVSSDPARDEAGAAGERDIVGAPPDAALYVVADASFLYMRMRVAATPLAMDGTFRPFGWGFELDTDGDFTAYEVLVILDGINNPDELVLAQNTSPGTTSDPTDIAETVVATYPATSHAWGTPAETTFGGSDNYYVTVAVPLADLATVGVDTASSVMWAGTSANARSLNADIACHDGSTGEPTLDTVPGASPTEPTDSDGDGIPDSIEQPGGVDQDTDGDGTPDHLDTDDDGDGVPTIDERPAGMDADTDGDGTPDHLDSDDDGDGIPTADERPGDMDVDTDGDGTPDYLDPDDDGDGIPTSVESSAPEGFDVDGDGVPNHLDTDSDADGMLDEDEGTDDTDGDGTPDYLDAGGPDADGDGIPDAIEQPGGMDRDTDGDGTPDHLDTDDDGDGIPTADERPGGMDVDTDGDGTPDHLDPDDDGDGIPTADERPGDMDVDTDGDGTPDHLDPDDGNVEGGLAGGAGCSAAGTGGGVGWLGLLLIGLVLGARRRRGVIAAIVGALTVAAVGGPTAAAQPRFTLDQYRPAPTASEGFAVARPDAYGHLRPSFQLHLEYANDPLVFERVQGDSSSELDRAIVGDHLVAHVAGAVGLFDRFVVFGRLPVNALLAGEASDSVPGPDGASLGDVALGVRYVLPSPEQLALAVQLAGTLPSARLTDGDASYAGEEGPTLHPALLGSVDLGGAEIALEVGARLRGQSELVDLELGNELTYGLGLAVPAADGRLEAHAEIFGVTSLRDFGGRQGSPLEVLGGVKARPDTGSGWIGGLALGTGLTRGYGAPDIRIVLSAGFVEPEPRPIASATASGPEPRSPDTDGDGLTDDVDACPREPEDADGFEDADGCPDPDNDADGVFDGDDGCPLQPEDVDGHEDADGCPDPDNDADGIADDRDRCPAEPEDRDEIADEDGCPEEDADEDTVVDTEDQCPTTPGVVETSIEECRGCPERACISMSGTIRILERVEFETDSAELKPESEPVLRDVLSILETNPQIRRVRVEGHTDDRGQAQYNLELSQRRAEAVVRWLTDRGITASRLEAQGLGETRPLRPGRSRRARQANRRVEFHIVGDEEAAASE